MSTTETTEEKNPYFDLIQPAIETTKSLLNPIGPIEAGLNLATQTYGLPATGIASLVGLPFGKSEPWSEAVAKSTIYEPRTEAGKNVTRAVGLPFELLGNTAEKVADVTREGLGKGPTPEEFPWMTEALPFGKQEPTPEERALAGTTAYTAIMGLPLLLGAKKAISKSTTTYPLIPKDVKTGLPSNPYMSLMENRIDSLRRQAKSVIERANPQEIEQLVRSGKMAIADIPEKMKPFLSSLLNERGSLSEVKLSKKNNVELRHYTSSEATQATQLYPDDNGLVWFTEGESYLKGPPKKSGKWGYIKFNIPKDKILRIDDTPGMLEEYLREHPEGRSKLAEMEFAESRGYDAIKRGNDIAIRPSTIKKYEKPSTPSGMLPAVKADGEVFAGTGGHAAIAQNPDYMNKISNAKDVKMGWVDTDGKFYSSIEEATKASKKLSEENK